MEVLEYSKLSKFIIYHQFKLLSLSEYLSRCLGLIFVGIGVSNVDCAIVLYLFGG